MTNDSGNEENLPLSGVRVLEFGSFLAGPFGTRFLGDFGAEVIKIEARDVPDAMRDWGPAKYKGRSLVWPIQSRNKKSITLNLRTPEAQALARKLIATTDVIVENFRPGTMEKWGLGYEDLKKDNPGLVMVRVSGYGQTGPYKNRAGFGSAAGAMGGLRHLTGYPDRPPTRVGLSIEDSLAALQAVIGTLLALRQREVHGSTGQVVDVSITESVFTMLEGAIPEYALTGHVRNRHGTTLPAVAPSNIYEAKDGVWMVIAANADNPFKRLFDLIGRPDIADDPRFMSHDGRFDEGEMLDKVIGEWAAQHNSAEITALLEPAGVPSAPIYTSAEMLNDPHFRAREMIIDVVDPEIGPMPMPGVFPRLVDTPGRVKWTGPSLGEHNDEVFKDILKLSDEEYSDYKERGII